jgi:ferric-dicitrate binding protein FerR (iron transport regulator)
MIPAPNPILRDLVSELTDGTLDQSGRDQLRQLLADDVDARRWYAHWMQLHSLLYLDLQYPNESVITPALAPKSSLSSDEIELELESFCPAKSRRRRRYGLAAAVVAALAASLLFAAFGPWSAPQPANEVAGNYRPVPERIAAFQATDGNAVAVLSRAAAARWADRAPRDVGSPVGAGKLDLASGIVQLEFLSGASVVVEGPAQLDLLSNKLIVCQRGKLRVYVPTQAKGFMVDAPRHRTVDLGTEFAIEVDADERTEIHVLKGIVEVFALNGEKTASAPRRLVAGDALRSLPGEGLESIAANARQFVGAEELLALAKQDSADRYRQWRQQSDVLRSDPRILAYFGFENHRPWQRLLEPSGPFADRLPVGAIVGCRWAEGRWPEKQALEFKSTEDRVRIDVPGEFDSITLACWVRIDGFDRWLSSLLLPDGHNLGEVHWQFTETGQLLLGVKADRDQSQEYLSETVLRPVDLGRWIHLACVYDKAAGEVRHYVDGRRVETHAIKLHTPLRFGPSELGNWVPEQFQDHRIRSLNGRMDEFALLEGCLSDEEINHLFEIGRPQ